MGNQLHNIISDAASKRKNIHTQVVAGFSGLFPVTEGGYTINVNNVVVEPKHYTLNDMKQARLRGSSLGEPVYGDLKITKGSPANVVLEKKKYLLMRVPYLTKHHTFIVDGNSYMVGSQLRTKAGMFARFRRNEVPEVSFNLAKGANFKLVMEPTTLVFNLEYGASKIPAYPIINALGVPDTDVKRMWGIKVFNSNKTGFSGSPDSAVTKLFEKIVPPKEREGVTSTKDKALKIRDYFTTTILDPEVTKATMGMGFRNVNGLALVAAGEKLVRITAQSADARSASDVEVDDRDSLRFQTIHSVEDFIRERILKGGREVVNKMKFRVKNLRPGDDFKKVMPTAPFNKTIKSLVTQFTMSRTPEQINPVEILDDVSRVTRMGEGGISSTRAILDETREVHPSHLGVLDPFRTSESSNTGVDIRATMRLKKDNNGHMYATVKNVKTGKLESIAVDKLHHVPLAFPAQNITGRVSVIKQDRVTDVPAAQVTYQVPHVTDMLGPAASLIPFINTVQGNRALMGAKQVTQALPLKYREEPLVQVATRPGAEHASVHKEFGAMLVKRAPEKGKVTKVDDDYIHFKGSSGKKYKMEIVNDLPFNSKTYMHDDLVVPINKTVPKDTQLTESNYTKNGTMALGVNAKIAYMPYNGLNSNDAIVVSDSAAKKFTSEHMYKETIDRDTNTILDKRLWLSRFPNKLTREKADRYDDHGVAKPGVVIEYGEPVILAIRKVEANSTDQLLGRFDKTLKRPMRDASVLWMKEFPGTVNDVHVGASQVNVTLKMAAPAVEGDKLSSLFGNKGVIGKIIPDDQMVKGEDGEPIDVLVTSAGVATRINPGQIVDAAVGKVHKKLGKPVIIDSFANNNEVSYAKKLLKKHGVQERETITDPMTGRKIPDIFTGNAYMLKLFKSTDTNFAARNTGSYTTNEQPAKGGKESAARIGNMELGALMAHGVPRLLEEVGGLKSQRNNEWWQAYQRGAPTPNVKKQFIVDKFTGMLNGSQIKMDRKGDKVSFLPLTDEDTIRQSSGSITKPTLLRGKDLKPEIGGLFDPAKTGGLEGKKWSHIELDEHIVKPMYKKPAASLLGVSGVKLDQLVAEKGGDAVRDMLRQVNTVKMKRESRDIIETGKGQKLDLAIKRHKYIDALERANLTPQDAYMGRTLPVVPPSMRPVVPGPNDSLLTADANHLYRDAILANQKLREVKEAGLPDEDVAAMRRELALSVGAVVGLNDPVSSKLQQQGKKGFIKKISGTKPSEGMFQHNILSRPQDISGRGTIAPDPNLGVDEIGLPEDTAYGMFKPMLVRNLVRKGYPALNALKHIEDKTDLARHVLKEELKTRPVIYNRAPTLHRANIVAGYGKLVPGKTVRITPFWEGASNADYDGDCALCYILILSTDKHWPFGKSDVTNTSNFNQKTGDSTVPQVENIVLNQKIIHISDFPKGDLIETKANGNTKYKPKFPVKVMGYNPETGVIEPADVESFSIHKNLEAFRVTTNRGRTGIFSKDRSIFAVDPSDMRPKETPTLESEGRLVPRYFGGEVPEKDVIKSIKLSDYYTKVHGDILKDELVLDEELGWFFGTLVSDGWGAVVSPSVKSANLSNLCAAIGQENIRDNYIHYVKSLTKVKAMCQETRNKGFYDGKYVSTKVTHVESDLGRLIKTLIGHGADNKHLPDFFMNAPREFKLGLLTGLTEGDGSFAKVQAKAKNKPQYMCMYHSSSERLIEELMLLCSSLGIDSRVTPYNGTVYGTVMQVLNISCESIWLQSIHFKYRDLKKDLLFRAMTAQGFSRSAGNNTNVIPFSAELAEGFLSEMKKKAPTCQVTQHIGTLQRAVRDDYADIRTLTKVTTLIRALDLHVPRELLNDIHKSEHVGRLSTTIKVNPEGILATVKLLKPYKQPAYKKYKSYGSMLRKSKKEGYITRQTAGELIDFIGKDNIEKLPLGELFLQYYNNNSVRWDIIEEVTRLDERMDMYDLTVPGYDTFMMANQMIAFDTVQLHVPVSVGAVQDTKKMLLSNNTLGDQHMNDLIAKPQHESIIGIYDALSKKPSGRRFKFSNMESAKRAYLDGTINTNDYVELEN